MVVVSPFFYSCLGTISFLSLLDYRDNGMSIMIIYKNDFQM